MSRRDVGSRSKAEALYAYSVLSAFQVLRRSIQISVRKLSELLFVEQEPGTAAAMNLAVVSQPSNDLGALALPGPASRTFLIGRTLERYQLSAYRHASSYYPSI